MLRRLLIDSASSQSTKLLPKPLKPVIALGMPPIRIRAGGHWEELA